MTVRDAGPLPVVCKRCGTAQHAPSRAQGYTCYACGTSWWAIRCPSCQRASVVRADTLRCPHCGHEPHGKRHDRQPTPVAPPDTRPSVWIGGVRYLGGHPFHDGPLLAAGLLLDRRGVQARAFGDVFTIPWSSVRSVEVEGPVEVSARLTMARLAQAGGAAWAVRVSYLTVATDRGDAIFEIRGLNPPELRAKLGRVLDAFGIGRRELVVGGSVVPARGDQPTPAEAERAAAEPEPTAAEAEHAAAEPLVAEREDADAEPEPMGPAPVFDLTGEPAAGLAAEARIPPSPPSEPVPDTPRRERQVEPLVLVGVPESEASHAIDTRGPRPSEPVSSMDTPVAPLEVMVVDSLWKLSHIRDRGLLTDSEVDDLRERLLRVLPGWEPRRDNGQVRVEETSERSPGTLASQSLRAPA